MKIRLDFYIQFPTGIDVQLWSKEVKHLRVEMNDADNVEQSCNGKSSLKLLECLKALSPPHWIIYSRYTHTN